MNSSSGVLKAFSEVQFIKPDMESIKYFIKHIEKLEEFIKQYIYIL